MTTLAAIGFTVAGGSLVLSTCLALFGVAVRKQLTPIAPRATARPPTVIYNPCAGGGHVQYRGNPFVGWIPWCLRLPYETLLKGVPGTGTRNGGTAGTLLHVTLDGIVLLRFHALGRRIALLSTFLGCCLLLPLYASAPCLPDLLASTKYMQLYECNATLTTFRQTTLSHVPDLQVDYAPSAYRAIHARLYVVVVSVWVVTLYAFYLLRQEWIDLLALRRVHYLEATRGGEKQSSQEWTNRLLMGATTRSSSAAVADEHYYDGGGGSGVLLDDETEDGQDGDEEEEPHLTRRPPWIPHPEQPDTVPNVEPYSVLVGHLPLPPPPPPPAAASAPTLQSATRGAHRRSDVSDQDDQENGNGHDDDGPLALPLWVVAEYQLRFLRGMLERSLPQEPGYSSPVAAVTIVPPSDSMGRCWQKWYASASALRRLEFVRSVLAERGGSGAATTTSSGSWGVEGQDGDCGGDDIDDEPSRHQQPLNSSIPAAVASPIASSSKAALKRSPAAPHSTVPLLSSPTTLPSASSPSPPAAMMISATISPLSFPSSSSLSSPEKQQHHRRRRQLGSASNKTYLWQVFGGHFYYPPLEDDIRASVTSSFGPEQMAVFSRELAQSASNCCPHGMREKRVRNLPIPDLKDCVLDAELELHRAVQELQAERSSVAFRMVPLPKEDRRRRPQQQRSSQRAYPIDPTMLVSKYLNKSTRQPFETLATYEMTKLTRDEGGIGSDSSGGPPSSARGIDRGGFVDGDEGDDLEQANGSKPSEASIRELNGTNPSRFIFWRESAISLFRDRDFLWKHICEVLWNLRGPRPSSVSDVVLRENSYAVLTFTSRQAAAAARQCISSRRDLSLHDIPIPPLADAAPCTVLPCRFVCRPVTVSAKDWQKNVRLYLILSWLGLMYIFYTIPLTWSTSQVDPDTIAWLFPDHSVISDSLGVNVPELISGLASSIIWSFFFMMCPQVFKLIAYFGSRATSLAQAERRAMQYFWWFMVLTAFTGPMLAYWVIGAVNKSQRLGDGLREVLIRIAGTTPTLIAANWLNWIIYRFTIILPINFLLQFNTFLFSFLGFNCCARLTIGGGPGGPVPYRIFVDSGVVLMCTFALAPSSPLVAPAALAYFCFCEPLLRRNLIFVYRPRYDDGGLRWIVVFDMIISALVVGQIILALQMGLKNALGPGLIATLAIPATIWFQWYCKRKFDPAFENTALLRTSLIDGWESLDEMTLEHREAHLRFLVDAHKAAYVPVCIAGTEISSRITAEPAVAVPHSIIDSDSEHSEPPLKPRRQSSQAGSETRSRAPSGEGSAPLFDGGDSDSGLGWLESALEPEDLAGAFGIFRSTPQKSE